VSKAKSQKSKNEHTELVKQKGNAKMIVVKADKTNELYRKGETVTKLNKRGESRLKNTVLHSLHHLQWSSKRDEDGKLMERSNYKTNPTYLQTIDLYVSLFGHRPSRYGY